MSAVETPTGRHLGTFIHESPEWIAARAAGLGGSEVAAVVGLSPWTSRHALWHRKKGLVDPQPTNRMRWGHYVEPALLKWYADTVVPVATDVGTYVHRDHPWMVANPDGLAEDRGVEAKSDHNPIGWGEPGTDQIPIQYRVQLQWYMAVTGHDRWDLIATISGNAPEVWTLKADPEDHAWLMAEAEEFLASLDAGEPPEIDGHRETLKTVRQLHPGIEDIAVEVPAELAEEYLLAGVNCRGAEVAKNRASARLADYIGNAKYATYQGRRIARRQAKKDGLPFLVAVNGVEITTAA